MIKGLNSLAFEKKYDGESSLDCTATCVVIGELEKTIEHRHTCSM